jgi:aminoglycoside phosphotransferase family enzyme
MDNYQKIIDSFLKGEVENLEEKGLIPEHIETQISHLFVFPNTVYKICKRDNTFFNEHFRNIADLQTRIDFYKSDFFENNYFSPDVYLGVFGIRMIDGKVTISEDLDDIEDIIMKMKRIDLGSNLSLLLHQNILTEEEFKKMGYEQTKAVALYPHQPKTDETYYDIFQRRLDDLRDWMYSAPDYLDKEKTDDIIKILRDYVEKNKDGFVDFDTSKYVISLDNHSDNIFFENGETFFLDIYPPKEDWMIVTPWINIYRPATDILILMGKKYAKALIQGYKDHYGRLDERHELFYFIYSACIQAISLHNLSSKNPMKKEDSIKYKDFIINNINKL